MRWLREGWPESLSGRLLAAYLGAWVLTAGTIGAALVWFLHGDHERWYDHSSLSMAVRVADQIQVEADGTPVARPLPEAVAWLQRLAPLEVGWRVFDAQGRVRLWSSPEVQAAWSAAALPLQAQPAHGRAQVGELALRLRTVALEREERGLWLQVGVSERLIRLIHEGNVSRTGLAVLATVLASVVLLGLAQFVVLRRLMRPIRRLSEEAVAIRHDRSGRRLEAGGLPLELQPLVQSFNESLQRQEEAFARQLHFLADAAHELKTPLSLLRFQIELGGAGEDMLLRDIDHLARQVHQLLLLAEVTEPRSYRHEAVDAAQLASQVCAMLAPMAARQGVALQLHADGTAEPLTADRSALAVLLKNLVENAIGHAPRGSTVQVEVHGGGMRVADQGPGIAPEHLPHLFERFWRAPSRRDTGAGLGLAICREVAQAHGWRLAVRNLAPGAEFALQTGAAA